MNAFISPCSVSRSLSSPATAAVSSRRTSFLPRANALRPRLPNITRRFSTVKASLEDDVRQDLNKLYETTPCMPIMVRLAWHDAGTYNATEKTGGANGSIRFNPEKSHGANSGLNIAMDLLQPIKDKYPNMSYADLYQLASVQAIEFSGGPKIPFRMGREDASEADCTPDGRLPDADKGMNHLRDIFYRMGFNDLEITTLSGAHTLGRAHPERSGFDGPWTKIPVVFDNSYYVEILKDEPDPDLLRLTSDLALLDSTETKALCEKYAADQDVFFEDYKVAHQKLSELGCFQ
ncbi:L-ascorbate peroxidase 3, peroxisomal [Gracilariopsis chorda]|uniref:L-ascorbate peroxidase 3, peroxisomal n=1 Tax=Gracilariopsis chorda TaxID=448386 RepID=A0A2V3INB6_9FLOR|nr:L-ascorbate peroxidase 3, peroxisomal [Gracilariopsis chorda]|eukprot:PXF43557.1 L-ascorbate peroxidase 3, peroxisomal [Gracilariopsis chorda]